MTKFLVTAQPVVITSYRIQYAVEANSPEEAEEIFRHPENHPGKLVQVFQDKQTTQGNRETIPLTIESLGRKSSPPAAELPAHPDH